MRRVVAHDAGKCKTNGLTIRLFCGKIDAMNDTQHREILQTFGLSQLRPGQSVLIDNALSGVNTLGVLPTGHGKSLCYQAAALLLGGTTVVVSPLIALMRDQVQSLQARGIAAARFDSTLADEARAALLADVAAGSIRLLFVAPESLESVALMEALSRAHLSLFVVDEAHCVSEWGHSFRPDYLKLPAWCRARGFRSVMALTATATLRVQQDLCRAFSIVPRHVVAHSPYRRNILRLVAAPEDRESALLAFLKSPVHRPAIVYTRTRKGAEQLSAVLQQAGLKAACYHAGQNAELREQLQDSFLTNTHDVLVATIAFGMGVDKPDVRSVVHFNAPGSPEAYLQESGRAGRDGKPSTSLVLLHGADLRDARNRICAAEPDAEGVLRAVRMLMPVGTRAVSLWELGATCDVPDDVAMRALALLEKAKAVQVGERGYKYYKVKPLFPFSSIIDGRESCEVKRLQWLDKHREGEVDELAAAWACSFAEAMEQLRECEASGEWKLSLRQQALCLTSIGTADARSVAAELSAAYARRTAAEHGRQEKVVDILCGKQGCINSALEQYFTNEVLPPCGVCAACAGSLPVSIPAAPPCPEPPPVAELPEFAREAQRRRFLLGLSSPGSMARRLWAHPLYGCCASAMWEEL